MSQHAFLYIVYVIVALLPAALALIAGLSLWAYRRTNGVSREAVGSALLMGGIVAEGLFCILIAGAFGYVVRPVPTLGHSWSFWIGRGLLLAAMLNYTRVLFGKRKRPGKSAVLTSEDERVLELERAHDRRVQELDAYHDARVKRRDATIHFLRNRLNALEAMAQSMGIHLPPMESQEEDPPHPGKNNG